MTNRWRSSLVVLGLLAGCASPAPAPAPAPPPTTGAVAPPTAAPTQVPALPVTSVPAATPTPSAPALSAEQASAITSARLLEAEGDYANAATRWRALLGTSAAAEARIGLALSQALAGDSTSAQQTLESGPADPRDGYVRGLALETQHQHAQAMQALADYANANAPVAAAVWLEIAERELSARRPQQAADATAKGLETAQARALKQQLLDVRAQALAALGDNEAAFDAHRQVLALATSTSALGEQLFRLAQVSRDLGKRDAALQALKTALDQFPNASSTPDALRLLDQLQAADQVDPFVLGRARYYAVDYRNAVTAFDRYLQTDPNGPDAPSAKLFRALASLTPGNEPNALRDLDSLADDPDQDSDIAAQALLEAGQALESLNEPDQAETHYEKLLAKFPRLDAAATAGFRLGLDRFIRGATSDAVTAWDGLIARRDDLTSDDVARAYYWRGKALSRLGQADAARASFTQAAGITPPSFYSLRAASVLGQLPSGSTQGTADADAQLAQWLAARGQDLAAANQLIAADPAVTRAQAEASIGLFRAGNWEADELLARYPDRADRLYALARRFGDLGLFGGATRLGQAAYAATSGQSPQDVPLALLAAAYPRPFANLSDEAARRYGIDPLLLDSTFHDASQFDAWSENATNGARGVAQISPVHADEAALALHTNPDDQFRPVAAIEAQAWLLADRLRRFDGRPEVALSAVATTERLVDGWAARPGADDLDSYVELIDYEGVRAGLRSLFATRLIYAAAYGTGSADPLGVESVGPEPTAAWIKIARFSGDVPPDAPMSPAANVGSADEQAAFAHAAIQQRDGDYDDAIATLTSLATSASAPEVTAAAQLRLGQSLIALRRPAEAVEPLQNAAAAHPGSIATYLLGRALVDMGNCQAALDQFTAFEATNPGPLAAQAQVARASCLADLGRAAEGVPVLEEAVGQTEVARLQTLDFRERLALQRLRAGDTDGARAEYQSLLGIARSTSYRAQLNYFLGLLAPDRATAASLFRTALQLDPKSRGAQAALDELVALHDPAARSFEAADARFSQNRYREALAAYSDVIAANPTDQRTPQAYYGRGVSLVRLGQDRAGIVVLEGIADRFPNTADAADGLFRGGRIRESLADLVGAADVYRRVIGMPNAGTRASDARFRLAFVQFEQGDLGAAAEGLRTLAGSGDADVRAQANFWLGKTLHAIGDASGARSAWAAATQADPRGFYGLRAADWLAGRSDPLAQAQVTVPLVAAHANDDPSAPLADWSAARGGDVAAARQTLFADPGLERAEALLAMGLRQPAIWELGAVEARVSSSVAATAQLGAWEQQRGLYNAALLLGYDLASAARVSLTSGPAAVRKLAYPLPNPLELQNAGRQLGVDPLLFSALMLQESLLDQNAESSAQARGLAQLTAATAYDAARALGVYAFHTTDLYQPKVAIQLGAFTLGERLSRYGQEIFPSLAAYNAAEFAVDGWLQSAGPADIDTFAEAIPFTETYPYVQHIYENYRQYLELYASP